MFSNSFDLRNGNPESALKIANASDALRFHQGGFFHRKSTIVAYGSTGFLIGML
jgi:hypothetical protein